jgi:5-methylcytosine-specific restriction endonuclease McrA
VNKRTGQNHPPVSMKAAVITRDGGLCVIALPGCRGEAQTTDHRANRQAGGSRILNDPVNLIGACVYCNDAKARAHGAVREELERRGINVLPSSTHAKTLERARETLVEYPDGLTYRLVDERTRELVTDQKEAA